jgi:hypothetical protein
MLLGNGSAITAGTQTVNIALTRGGQLRLCSTTQVHLSHDRTIDAPDSSALMMALDRGAIETDYDTGKYSDVLLTPDLRILISPPGHADIRVRVNARGDTCIDNHGAQAPYITVTSQFDGGLYRLRPDQHVTFERGSLHDVIDTEREPCGCPAPVSVADAGTASPNAADPGKRVGGPSSTPADTTFPLAESEGLAPPPPPPTEPVAKPGEVHVQVSVPLTYNGEAPPAASGNASGSSAAAAPPTNATTPKPRPASAANTQTAIAQAPVVLPEPATKQTPAKNEPGFLHRVGHFLSRIFGGA